jgi:hypothetical protein
MILATHALGGTVAALLFRSNPVLAFCAAFASHFALDAIPHWDYPVRSLERSGQTGEPIRKLDSVLLGDIARTGLDFVVGAALSFFLATPDGVSAIIIVGLGVVGGVLPDFLQLVYYILKAGPILQLQKFHQWVHAADRRLKTMPALGVPVQIVIAGVLAWLIVFLR